MCYGKIYLITNLINNKKYVGQTTAESIEYRFYNHCQEKRNRYISNAIRKYGKENFKIEQLDIANSIDELNEKEVFFVESLSTMYPNGYNHRAGGSQNGKCSEELKRKISNSKKGKPNLKRRGELRSENYRIKIARGLGGKSILATNIKTGEQIVLQTIREGIKYGFNPSNIVSICKNNSSRKQTKGYTFSYIEDQANQTGSLEIKKS